MTASDGRWFLGCIVHYIVDGILKNNIPLFKEVPPPHTIINIRICFEDELDRCSVKPFLVVTDNAANMKCSFTMEVDIGLNSNTPDSDDDFDDDDIADDNSYKTDLEY